MSRHESRLQFPSENDLIGGNVIPPTSSDGKALPSQEKQGSHSGDANVNTTIDASGNYLSSQSGVRRMLLVGVLACSGLLNILTVQAVVIMLPTIGKDLKIPTNQQQMVTSVYSISSGCTILLWSRLADIYGRTMIFLIGSTLFTLATLCIPFSPEKVCFYVLRALQGMSGAALIPSALGIIAAMFPPGKTRNKAFVTMSAAASLGSTLGNIAGGIIGSYLSWKWVFWIPAILASIVTVLAFLLISPPRASMKIRTEPIGDIWQSQARKRPFVDWFGGFLITSTLIALLVALSQGNVIGWSKPWIGTLIGVSVVLLLLFGFWQARLENDTTGRQPLLRISMFNNLEFSALFVTVSCFYAAFNSFLIFATFFYQDYQHISLIGTTLRFLPAGISGIIVAFILPPVLSRISGFHLLLFGIVCGIISPFLLALPVIPPSTTYWAYGFPAMCLCFSVDIVWPAISLFIAQKLPPEDQALGGGLLQTANQIGRSFGQAIATAVQTAIQQESSSEIGAAFLSGVRAGQWVNVGLAAFALVVAICFLQRVGKADSG